MFHRQQLSSSTNTFEKIFKGYRSSWVKNADFPLLCRQWRAGVWILSSHIIAACGRASIPIILALLWWEEAETGESRKLGSHVTWCVLANSTKDPVTNKANAEGPQAHKCVSSPSVCGTCMTLSLKHRQIEKIALIFPFIFHV